MANPIDVHPEARQEITGSLRYYESTDPILAEDLDARIDAAVAGVENHHGARIMRSGHGHRVDGGDGAARVSSGRRARARRPI